MNIKSIIIFILTPIFTNARLKINITVESNKRDMFVRTFGTDIKLATETEKQIFNFSDSNINRGFRVELGKAPDHFFLNDPTLYENLFEQFKWEPVKRIMSVSDVKILDTVSENTVLKVRRYTNYSPDTIRANVSIYKNVENTIHSLWSKQGVPDDDIYYDVIINVNDRHIDYSNQWRDNQVRSRTLAVGLSQDGYIEIKPGKTITAKLLANKTVALIEIQYKALLTGSIIGDYESLYGKYHFYAPSVKSIMRAAELKNDIYTTELLEVRCYTSPRLDFKDENGRKVHIIRPKMPLRSKKKRPVPVQSVE